MEYLKGWREYLTPVLQTSSFQEKGMLTPAEFVLAGDELVAKSRSWTWQAGDPSNQKAYLPSDKQYLVTKRVPCLARVRDYRLDEAREEEVEGKGEDAWVSTHIDIRPTHTTAAEAVKDMDLTDLDSKDDGAVQKVQGILGGLTIDETYVGATTDPTAAPVPVPAPTEEDDLLADMEEEGLGQEDEASLAPPLMTAQEPEETVVKTRTYDFSITYDNYHRTPRVYLLGYDEHSQPLTSDQILEDISADHRGQTVTIDPHPHTGEMNASIHPCQHANVMKKLCDQLALRYVEEDKASDSASQPSTDDPSSSAAPAPTTMGLDVSQYLFLFLKFMSSVIPTIEYDYTRAI